MNGTARTHREEAGFGPDLEFGGMGGAEADTGHEIRWSRSAETPVFTELFLSVLPKGRSWDDSGTQPVSRSVPPHIAKVLFLLNPSFQCWMLHVCILALFSLLMKVSKPLFYTEYSLCF